MKLRKESLNNILLFFEDFNYENNSIDISECEKIEDLKKFVKSHVGFLKGNKGNRLFLPYYDRLNYVYNKLKENENS